MIFDSQSQQPEIDYPCPWDYKVIVSDYQVARDRIERVLTTYTYQCEETNVSRHGNYKTLHVRVIVFSDQDRHDIFDKLSTIPQVKYIL